MSVSVALCTRNGMAYLPALWKDLLAQELLPDEIVVSDDGSTDGTWEFLSRAAAAAPLPVKLFSNSAALGVAANFQRAMLQCGGEFIALCDQDDRWRADKLRRSVYRLQQSGGGGVFCDGRLIDAADRDLGRRLWPAVGFGQLLQSQWNQSTAWRILLGRNVATGSAMIIEANYLNWLLPIPPGGQHDAWLALLLASAGKLHRLALPLLRYRIHAGQQTGVWNRHPLRRWRNAAKLTATACELEADLAAAAAKRLKAAPCAIAPAVFAHLRAKERLWHRRTTLRVGHGGLAAVLADFLGGDYQRYALGWRSALQDLLCPLGTRSMP